MDPIGFALEPYTDALRSWLDAGDHYLHNAPPGALFAVVVRDLAPGLFGPTASGELRGAVVIGRPIARMLPQDGSVGEVTRMWLQPGLPKGTASAALTFAAGVAAGRGMKALIAYHDRTRHTGCVYRKAGFRKNGTTDQRCPGTWATRTRPASADVGSTPKRRWRLDLVAA